MNNRTYGNSLHSVAPRGFAMRQRRSVGLNIDIRSRITLTIGCLLDGCMTALAAGLPKNAITGGIKLSHKPCVPVQ